jgi:hypothetical protein
MKSKFSLNANADLFDFRKTQKPPKELGHLHAYELINYITHNNPSLKSPKAIAVDTKKDISTVYRWGENPKCNGIELIPETLIDYIKSTKSINLIVRYLKARCEE